MSERVAFHVYYSGAVQGVGFRYTAVRLAERSRVTGWVKNLHDGRVELWVEGGASEVDSFLSDIKENFSGYIRGVDKSPAGPQGEWKDFRITW